MSLVNAQALMGLSSEMSNVSAEAEQMAQDMNTASITVGQLATQTGIAEPQMVSLINNISNATFPNEEAMMYVKSLDQMGVSSENLGKSATDLDKINDAFGLGASTVNSLGQELGVLGVDMNNVSTAFNSLAYANANTVGGMENYFSFLRRFDADLNQLGYNADQTALIISAATQKYGGGRAALTGLSSALKDAGNDSRALEQALGLQAGALDNASQITGQYEGQLQALADEEAEHKTIVDQIGAAWEDMSLSLSPVLSPLGSFMGMIGQAGSWAVGVNGLIELANSFRKLSVVQSAITWLKELEITNKLVSLSQLELNFAFLMNPIFLVVAAVVALIAVLGYLYFNNEQVRASIDGLGQTLMGFGQWVYNGAIYWINQLLTTLQNLWNYITTLGGLLPANVNLTGNKIIDTILRVILFIATLPAQLGMIFINIIARALGFGNNFTQRMINGASNAVNGFISWIATLPGKLWAELNKMLKMAQDFAMRIADTLTFGGASMVTGWQYGSGEHSPGYMYESFKGELDAMDSMAVTGSDKINSKMSKAGAGIVESFNRMLDFDFNWDWLKDFDFKDWLKDFDFKGITTNIPNNKDINFDIKKDNTSNTDLVKVITNNEKSKSGDTIINIYGDVDSDKRVEQILERIRRELSWDNSTAGRRV